MRIPKLRQGILATSILHISKRLAGHRASSATCHNCLGSVLFFVRALQGTFTVCLNHSPRNWSWTGILFLLGLWTPVCGTLIAVVKYGLLILVPALGLPSCWQR